MERQDGASAIPPISDEEIRTYLDRAQASPRRRSPWILHEPGAERNRVLNFIMQDSYMRPHCHRSSGAVERIHVVRGRLAVVYFADDGAVCRVIRLETGDSVDVPVGQWHTYLVLSNEAVTFETMTGVYDPATWKAFADWSPEEGSPDAGEWFDALRRSIAAA